MNTARLTHAFLLRLFRDCVNYLIVEVDVFAALTKLVMALAHLLVHVGHFLLHFIKVMILNVLLIVFNHIQLRVAFFIFSFLP